MMRILYVHERMGALAGAEANAFITGTELHGRGHTMGLLHGPGTGKQEDRWAATFPERFPLEAGDNGALVRRALSAFRPDVVYVHKMADLSVIEALVASGVPLVRMVHDHDIYCMRSYKYNPLTRAICTKAAGPHCVFPCLGHVVRDRGGKFPIKLQSYSDKRREIELNRKFDRMVVVTTYMRDELIRNGFDPGRIEIHAPVPRDVDQSVSSTMSERNLIIYAGQITRGKGVDVLLESLALLDMPFECIILGDGHYKAHCEALSKKLGLTDRVHFKGFVPQEELKSYYAECSAVALSSLWPEPIATIGLEVMRFGLPVVAFDAGGIKDWLIDGHNGCLVPWMDRAAYARALAKVLKDKVRARRLGENGRKLVAEKYDFQGYIDDLEGLFANVAAGINQQVPAAA